MYSPKQNFDYLKDIPSRQTIFQLISMFFVVLITTHTVETRIFYKIYDKINKISLCCSLTNDATSFTLLFSFLV